MTDAEYEACKQRELAEQKYFWHLSHPSNQPISNKGE